METDDEHRRPLTGGSRTPPGDKNSEYRSVSACSVRGPAGGCLPPRGLPGDYTLIKGPLAAVINRA